MAGWGSIHRNTLWSMRSQMRNLTRIQEQIATGSQVIRASDEPSDAFRILSLQADQKDYNTYKRNLDTVDFNLQHVASTVEEITGQFSTVKARMVQGGSDTYNQSDRAAIGEEIDAVLEQVVAMVNEETMGRHVFAGGRTDTPAYRVERRDGRIVGVEYRGDNRSLQTRVGPGMDMKTAVVGEDIFRSSRPQTPEMFGSTGAAAGSGTSTVRGNLWLDITHGTTSFTQNTPAPPDDSGIRAGASSDSDDTIVGDHRLTVDTSGASPTIQLDDGAKLAFTGDETDLEVRGSDGQVVHVDVSGWDGNDAVIDLHATAEMSIDGGQNSTEVDFSANQAVTDATTGEVLYVDTRNVQTVGAEAVQVGGSYDAFGALIHARDLMLNTRGLSHEEQSEQLDRAMGSVDEVLSGLTRNLASVGGVLQAAETMSTSMDDLEHNAEQEKTSLSQADVGQLAADLAQGQVYYQMALASSGKLLNLSLLNYIR